MSTALNEARNLLEQTIEVLEGFGGYFSVESWSVAGWFHNKAKPLLDNLKARKKET